MSDDMQIFRSDDLGALIREYADRSWEAAGDVVMEVLEETLDPQQAAAMTPRDWVRLGFQQGAGHLILALAAGEVRLEQTAAREQRRPGGRRDLYGGERTAA
jgi:hypothetical protein